MDENTHTHTSDTHACSLLTELWLDWIRDELKHQRAGGREDRERIFGLFSRAVGDYLCMFSLSL
jgi:hypothetical protein